MGRRKQPGRRKLRTREHIIAELGVNYVERQVLLRGFTVERIVHDYGIDLTMYTFDHFGAAESGDVAIQVKATDGLKGSAHRMTASCRIDYGDAKRWLYECRPVILILYDALRECAYWLYFQRYAETTGLDEDAKGRVTVRIPLANRLDRIAIDTFREFRENLMRQSKGSLDHGQ